MRVVNHVALAVAVSFALSGCFSREVRRSIDDDGRRRRLPLNARPSPTIATRFKPQSASISRYAR